MAGLGAFTALAITFFKISISFYGDPHYVAAILERSSLAGLAAMTLANIVALSVPAVLIWGSGSIASPRTSARMRSIWMWALPFGVTLFSQVVPGLVILMMAAAYLIVRARFFFAAKASIETTESGLESWGRDNQDHLDTKLRKLAGQARHAVSLSKDDRATLSKKINARLKALRPSREWEMATQAWTAMGSMVIIAMTSPATFSAPYEVKTTSETQAAYLIQGPYDVLLINTRTRVPQVRPRAEILSWRLCVPEGSNDWLWHSWLPGRPDTNPTCPR